MKNKKKIFKIVKLGLLLIMILLIFISAFMIYKNLFSGSNSNRYEGIENYKLTKEEIASVEETFSEIDKINDIDVYVNSKIIRIYILLDEDVDFKVVKKVSNEALKKFSEDNLGYYDFEIFLDSKNEESDIYPKIGYKNKLNEKFSW